MVVGGYVDRSKLEAQRKETEKTDERRKEKERGVFVRGPFVANGSERDEETAERRGGRLF